MGLARKEPERCQEKVTNDGSRLRFHEGVPEQAFSEGDLFDESWITMEL